MQLEGNAKAGYSLRSAAELGDDVEIPPPPPVPVYPPEIPKGQLCLAETRYGYEYIPDVDGWLRLYTVPSTWANARLRCQLEGGTLASPQSNPLAAAMMKMMGENGQNLNIVYTGINANIAKDDYMTIDGLPLSNISLKWAAGEPNNCENSEECLVMNGAGELADVNCSRVFGYFCFKKSAKMSKTKCDTWDSDYQLDPRTGSCYKFHTAQHNWHRAALTCRAEQAHLAVINSDTEARVLKKLFAKYPREKNIQNNP
ncbi:hypothetical protein MSG28_002518 [Choristoneura fumiferana]|uniref:Uncharacterized protein n=1 Tax=Choristoneura fumiferana TaxID=7141 RepID=A0ACC0JW24_CHOFU|nr:hypothetical protein MSG28_002518 [Choristoneura fumiferana]